MAFVGLLFNDLSKVREAICDRSRRILAGKSSTALDTHTV